MVIGEGYAELWKAIIRPPRDEYSVDDLGPVQFSIHERNYRRTDLTLTNQRSLDIKCSHFEPAPTERAAEKLPCVVYLHGNCSSRLEALSCLPVLLPSNITVFAFDFSGSGQSEGEYISLGYWERDDVATVISYLRESGRTTCIGLWGRSMGAVTALLHGDRDPSIGGMVVDSPFSSLRTLAEELCDTYVRWKLPKWLVGAAIGLLRSTVMSKAQFDIDDLVPIDHVSQTFIPALFIAARNDQFIQPHHAKELHERYAGDKNFVDVEGDHNSARPVYLLDSVMIFFRTTLQCDRISPRRPKALSPITHRAAATGKDLKQLLAEGQARSYQNSPRSRTSPNPNPRKGAPAKGPPRRHEMQPPEQCFHFSRTNKKM